MHFLRRYIIAPIILWILLAGAFCFAAGTFFERMDIAMGTFVLLTIIILVVKLHLPMSKIIREMKALLTGKSYKKIMTSKRNEIGVLAHFFNEITRNLENISGQVKSHKRITKELDKAQQIQKDLVPEKLPEIKGLEVTAKTRPASELGGDTFDFIIKNNRPLFYIGDSTGHGIPAGIVMVMVDTLIETFIDLYEKLTDIMIQLNKYLKPHLQTTMFMTMILAEWVDSEKKLKWIGAGHEHVIHVKTATGEVTATPAGGIAVGMLPDNSKMVKEQELQLQENDFVILFTDGIIEAKNVTGEVYGLDRLNTIAKSYASPQTSTDEMFKQIAIDVGRFMSGAEQLDDMTLIVIKASQAQQNKEEASTEWEES